MSEVISVRVRKGTKEALEKAGIDPSEEVRRHLDELAWESRCRSALKDIDTIIEEKVKQSKKGFAARAVREDRDAHS